jgi:hypothetical protein
MIIPKRVKTLTQNRMLSIIAAIQGIQRDIPVGQSIAQKKIPGGAKRRQDFAVLICSIPRSPKALHVALAECVLVFGWQQHSPLPGRFWDDKVSERKN